MGLQNMYIRIRTGEIVLPPTSAAPLAAKAVQASTSSLVGRGPGTGPSSSVKGTTSAKGTTGVTAAGDKAGRKPWPKGRTVRCEIGTVRCDLSFVASECSFLPCVRFHTITHRLSVREQMLLAAQQAAAELSNTNRWEGWMEEVWE